MQGFEPEISAIEIFEYLGYKGQIVNAALAAKAQRAIELCKGALTLKNAIRRFDLKSDMRLDQTPVALQGKSIAAHLKGCKSVYLVAATCGFTLDKLIAQLFSADGTLALLCDGAGSVAVEKYLNFLEKALPSDKTSRFSCGYGDFPLSQNADIVRLLNAEKLIGLKVTADFLLSPKKSVTAVIGIGQKGEAVCDFNCKACKFEKCKLIKG